MSCSTLETEAQAQNQHQMSLLEFLKRPQANANRIFSPIGPKGGSIGLLLGRQKHQKLAPFHLRHQAGP